MLLAKGTADPLPASYERIYSACQAVVCNAQKGEGIYEYLKMQMERSFDVLRKDLLSDQRVGVAWLEPFIQTCEWFEKQVVRKGDYH